MIGNGQIEYREEYERWRILATADNDLNDELENMDER